jgi:hypothetical protein
MNFMSKLILRLKLQDQMIMLKITIIKRFKATKWFMKYLRLKEQIAKLKGGFFGRGYFVGNLGLAT